MTGERERKRERESERVRERERERESKREKKGDRESAILVNCDRFRGYISSNHILYPKKVSKKD